jgi:ribose 5-phosphate isomerase RpiB
MFPFLNNEEREHYVARSQEQVKLVESVIDYIEDENIEIKDLGTIHKYLGQLPEVSNQGLRSF